MSEFYVPSSFGADRYLGDAEATARMLHIAGIGEPQVATDPPDLYGIETDPDTISEIAVDQPEEWQREHVPQFGPPFVKFVQKRFADIEERQKELSDRFAKAWSYQPTTFFVFASMQADASGNIRRGVQQNAIFLEPNPGWTMALHRLTIFFPTSAFTFGSPFNAAGAYWELRINDEMVDGGSLVSGQGSFPVARSWGTRDAVRIRDGEVGSLFVVGTATFANVQVGVKAQGTWERVIEG